MDDRTLTADAQSAADMAGDDEQETQCVMFSYHSGGAARTRRNLRNTPASTQNVQQISSFKIDKAKHKVFLSHSGAQKDFVEQLCEDLEARAYMFPFFDQRHHSLPKGKDFVPFIKKAAQRCRVAVIVLSEEFLLSKWPMIELAEFHAAQQAGNQQLNMLPLFYKLAVVDLEDRVIKDKWMPRWRKLAKGDRRIDVEKFVAAVRALRKANGLVFGKHSLTEVDYRKEIVQSISQLSPPDLLYGSSREMVGYDRMCKIASSRFVNDGSAGPSLLGLYGTTGRGKTFLCKALCDHFSAEFLGRVCHVDLGEMSTMDLQEMMLERPKLMVKRVKLMLKNVCGFERDVLDRVTDYSQALELLRDHVHREPVFLALDNVSGDESSLREAREYLKVGFHPKSRILITSRSVVNVQDFLPGSQFCIMAMPKLTVKEAGEIFLRSAAPMKSISGLTDEELRIVGLCIKHCLFESEGFESQGDDVLLELDDESVGDESDDESEGDESDSDSRDSDSDEVWCEPDVEEKQFLSESELRESRLRSFHPVALSALGDFVRRYSGNKPMLLWKDELQSFQPFKDIWRCSDGIGRIINLQFSSLDPRERLLFLDIALYYPSGFYTSFIGVIGTFYAQSGYRWLEWLSELHGDSESFMRRQLHDLTRSSMIMWDDPYEDGFRLLTVPTVYRDFAEWYATEHGLRELSKNSWGVLSGAAQKRDFRRSDLVRLRVFELSCASSRLLASKTMQELHNLEVLHLHSCPNLTELNIQGLDRLRELELFLLEKLVTVTLSGCSGADENGGIFESLRSVRLRYLDSLTHGPDLRSCTSLHCLTVWGCPKWTNLEQISECRDLKDLELGRLYPQQWASIPIVESLPSLQYFSVWTVGYVGLNDVIHAVEGLECWDQAFMLGELLGHLRSVISVDDSSPDVVYAHEDYVGISWNRRGSDKLHVRDSKDIYRIWR